MGVIPECGASLVAALQSGIGMAMAALCVWGIFFSLGPGHGPAVPSEISVLPLNSVDGISSCLAGLHCPQDKGNVAFGLFQPTFLPHPHLHPFFPVPMVVFQDVFQEQKILLLDPLGCCWELLLRNRIRFLGAKAQKFLHT